MRHSLFANRQTTPEEEEDEEARSPPARVCPAPRPADRVRFLSVHGLSLPASVLDMSLVAAVRRVAHVAVRDYSRRSAAARGAWLAGRRNFTGGSQPVRSENKVTIHFVNRDGEKITVKGSPGDSLLDVVINEDLDFDGFGACEGTLACSTCHLIFDEDVYKDLGPVTDEELDMLDLAYGLTDTSRLGCQICLTKSLEGVVARVPESVADIRQSKDESV